MLAEFLEFLEARGIRLYVQDGEIQTNREPTPDVAEKIAETVASYRTALLALLPKRSSGVPAKIRVELLGETGEPVTAPIWVAVDRAVGPNLVVTLLHEYPDIFPQEGWAIVRDGKVYLVHAVNGLTLDTELTDG
jgi:hypothetical protein